MRLLAALLLVLASAAGSDARSREPARTPPVFPFGGEGVLRQVERARVVGQSFNAATWRRVKTYDMQALQQLDPLPLRQIVGVRFNYRQERIRHWKPNWYQGSIWRYRRETRDEFDYIQVVVAKADLESFKAISSDFRAGREYLVYGEVLKDMDANFIFLRLLGTSVKRDARGDVTVGW